MFLKEKYQDIGNQLKTKDREKFDRFLGFEKDKDTVNTIKSEIFEMLYDNKEIPMVTKRKWDQSIKNAAEKEKLKAITHS